MADEWTYQINGQKLETLDGLRKDKMEALYSGTENPWHEGDQQKSVHMAMWDKFLPHLPERLRILDLGCGEGQYANNLFDKLGSRIDLFHGVDVSPTAIERARTRLGLRSDIVPSKYKFEATDYVKDTTLHKLIADSEYNIIMAVESLYYNTEGCTRAQAAVDRHTPSGTFFINGDSLKLYVCRMHLQKKLGWNELDKFTMKYNQKSNRSFISFLCQKP